MGREEAITVTLINGICLIGKSVMSKATISVMVFNWLLWELGIKTIAQSLDQLCNNQSAVVGEGVKRGDGNTLTIILCGHIGVFAWRAVCMFFSSAFQLIPEQSSSPIDQKLH